MPKVTFEYSVAEAEKLLADHFKSNPANDNIDVIIKAPPTAPNALEFVHIEIVKLLSQGNVDGAVQSAIDIHGMSEYETREWVETLQSRFFEPVNPNAKQFELLNVVPISVLNAIAEGRMIDASMAASTHFNLSSIKANDYVQNIRRIYFVHFHKRMVEMLPK